MRQDQQVGNMSSADNIYVVLGSRMAKNCFILHNEQYVLSK